MFKSLASILIILLHLSPGNGTFEQLQLVFTWPTAFCHKVNCVRIPNNFTIHGLWPDNKSRRLNFCKSTKYIKSTDEGKKAYLEYRWPNLTTTEVESKKNQFFWEKEYIKHGTCCLPLYDQNAYFKLAVDLKDKFDLLNLLGKHGIRPGTTHLTSQKIANAIRTETRGIPNISCYDDFQGTSELLEIGICFDPNAIVKNCFRPKSCLPKGTTGVTFP
uniref:Self-incompatibility ribonuclease n=1 Tax=Solanum chacoense TaxID=4108 RepID=Q9S7K5_SOLCH|nr:self-incompatibility ribonuclease [Solanum chacoense]AAF05729.1 self-incompatibility ribonuclease [Solanum chacoense]